MSNNTVTKSIDKVKPHPLYERIYSVHGPEDVESLQELIERDGIQKAILITKDGLIIDGHRRWYAARALGLATIPVQVAEASKDKDYAFLSAHIHRIKTNEQKAREASLWMPYEAELAKDRMKAYWHATSPRLQSETPKN